MKPDIVTPLRCRTNEGWMKVHLQKLMQKLMSSQKYNGDDH